MEVGSHVYYVDENGKAHDALVIHDWGSCINVVYVTEGEGDSFGSPREFATSVPPRADGMSGVYYVEPA